MDQSRIEIFLNMRSQNIFLEVKKKNTGLSALIIQKGKAIKRKDTKYQTEGPTLKK
jgi:hypothetical protein